MIANAEARYDDAVSRVRKQAKELQKNLAQAKTQRSKSTPWRNNKKMGDKFLDLHEQLLASKWSGYVAYCYIKKADVLNLRWVLEEFIFNPHAYKFVLMELASRWSNLSELERTQWRELAIEAPNAEALKHLLETEPQMMPGND